MLALVDGLVPFMPQTILDAARVQLPFVSYLVLVQALLECGGTSRLFLRAPDHDSDPAGDDKDDLPGLLQTV